MKPRMLGLVVGVLLVANAQAQAQTQTTATAPTAEQIDANVRAVIARYQLPGIAVGVIENGKVVN